MFGTLPRRPRGCASVSFSFAEDLFFCRQENQTTAGHIHSALDTPGSQPIQQMSFAVFTHFPHTGGYALALPAIRRPNG